MNVTNESNKNVSHQYNNFICDNLVLAGQYNAGLSNPLTYSKQQNLSLILFVKFSLSMFVFYTSVPNTNPFIDNESGE